MVNCTFMYRVKVIAGEKGRIGAAVMDKQECH